MFRDFPDALPASVEPLAVQLPGRDDRFGEPAYSDMRLLVPALIGVVAPLVDRPYAFYGASMGARVALSLAHALRAAGLPGPGRLFVAGSAAPALRAPVRGWADSEEGLLAYLYELGGTPEAVLASPELREMFLPTVRADLAVVGTCPPPPRPPLSVPIRAFAGADDLEASPDRMARWSEETSGPFTLSVVSGGHFFDDAGRRRVLAETAADLLALG